MDRTGLYIMVIFILLGTCHNDDHLGRIEAKLDAERTEDLVVGEHGPEMPEWIAIIRER